MVTATMVTATVGDSTVTKLRKTSFIQDLGEILGIPIKVRPWWGSVRGRFNNGPLKWQCSGGYNSSQLKRPEIQKKTIILWEGQCKKRGAYQFGNHTHSQILEVKSIGEDSRAILLRIRIGQIFTQYLISVDDESPLCRPRKPVA